MTKSGVRLIADERERQVAEEGYDTDHDADHAVELVQAAAAYARAAGWLAEGGRKVSAPVTPWPWGSDQWKPGTDPVRAMVKAGALLAAAIDSLQEYAPPAPESGVAKDRYLGLTFEDLDRRSHGRRVRVVERLQDRSLFGLTGREAVYRAVRVNGAGVPYEHARRVRISAKTLETRYRKVSH